MHFGIKDIKELTSAMSGYPHMDYTNFAFSFLKRRLAFVFARLNIKRKEPFINALSIESFRNRVIDLMCVEVTEMFRDPAFWRSFRNKILPRLPSHSKVIWLPMESSGEEAFSLAIILHENNLTDKYQIICHNPSLQLCDKIRNGKINAKHLDVNQTNYRRLEENDAFSQYFTHENGNMIMCDNIKNQITCFHNSFPCDPKSNNIGFIFFRNTSIYYNHKMAEMSFDILFEKLMPGGFLAIGIKEELPRSIKDQLIVIDQAEKIYQKPYNKHNYHYAAP